MKAREWAPLFQGVEASDKPALEKYADLLKDYGEETNKLIAERTKTSKDDSVYPAAAAAVREQQSKWRAICSQVADLSEDMFNAVIELHCADFKKIEAAAAKKKEQDAAAAAKKDQQDNSGRKFGGNRGGRKFEKKKQQ